MPTTVFIRWSGDRSEHIAKALKRWLLAFFGRHHLDIWLSTEMEPGVRWNDAISQSLEKANYGILCLTRENIDRPWILFEAGAISKATRIARVCPYLYDVDRSLIAGGPLGQFQAAEANRKGTLELVSSLHKLLDTPVFDPEPVLMRHFDVMWPELDTLLLDTPGYETIQLSERSDREILEDIWKSLRSTNARMYFAELSEPPEVRNIPLYELTTALHTVILWIFDELRLQYIPSSIVDYEAEIGGQTVLIETKIGNLLDRPYLDNVLFQVQKARNQLAFRD